MLSVTLNVAGTESIVKVRGGERWNPGWLSVPGFVIRVFDRDDLPETHVMLENPAWRVVEGAEP